MIHPFFQQNPFRADGVSELENDAKLALHLVLFLLSTQNPDDGTWPGVHGGITLRNTCHALEALHLLGWKAIAGAIEAATAWLVNLPDLYGFALEEQDSIRLYPSRFKTLAWLGEFTDPQLLKDFEQMEGCLDENGVLRDIMANQQLATMVYVDCLDYLERLGQLSASSRAKRERALNQIEGGVFVWRQNLEQEPQRSPFTSVGDLSYAIDLLFRAKRLARQSEIGQAAMLALIAALEHPESLHPIPSDALYCGIQLAQHFPDVTQARTAVRNLINHLQTKYEKLDLKKEADFFHSLVLRVMLAYHGDRLKAEMTRLLLEHERQNFELRRQRAEEALKDDFRALIKKRFEVEISEVRPLTGGITKAKVFRVHFALKLSASHEGREVHINTYQPTPGSLVIKSDSLDALHQSIRRYRDLPETLKPYFAQYTGEPQILEAASRAPGYLIMEDLTYMNTFQDILARIDQGRLLTAQKEELVQACEAICAGLFAIYNQTRRGATDFFGSQLSRLYLSQLEKSLIRMCRADKFPHLKSWFRGFWLGQQKYPSIEYYLGKLESHKAKLKIPYLMLTHGDCHSRNIMLDTRLQQLKLIDLDKLDEDGDYIKDLALLLEDVSVFRFLFDEGYKFYLDKDLTRFVSDSTEPKVIENKIEYPPFSSEAVRLFQQRLLQHLARYAQAINDETWKERLWLALATHLMYLATKQTEKGQATVLYVEAVKLLDELVARLDKGSSLGEIPFPGQHPAGVTRSSDRQELTVPVWYQKESSLAALHDGVMRLDPAIKCDLTAAGRVAKYFTTDAQRPFAVIDGKRRPPSVLLACSPHTLNDPSGIAQERETDSPFQSIVRVSEQEKAATVLGLIQQAFELNNGS